MNRGLRSFREYVLGLKNDIFRFFCYHGLKRIVMVYRFQTWPNYKRENGLMEMLLLCLMQNV